MHVSDVEQIAQGLRGVARKTSGGLTHWRYHGRLVARQLDATHIVIRADFDVRAALLDESPSTFSVPEKFARHMMVVADLEAGDADAIESALHAAWALQVSQD